MKTRVGISGFRPFFSGLALTALVGAVLVCSGCGKKENMDEKGKPPALPVTTITPTSAVVTTEYSSRLEGRVDIEIRPQVDGVLQKLFVKEGDMVKKGQSLFAIDDALYREEYNNKLAALKAAEANAAIARTEAEKLEPLVMNKVVSPVQLATAKAKYDEAKANVGKATAEVGAARINLDYSLIKAPVSGSIGKISFRQGALLTKNQVQTLTVLSDIEQMYAVFSISEVEFRRFKTLYPGSTLQNKIAAVPPLSLTLSDGTVYDHEGMLESVSGGFDRLTGAVSMRAVFPNPEGMLRSGNSGKVGLRSRYEGVMLVPQSATAELQDKVFVFLLTKGNHVKKQVISVSGSGSGNYIVTDGLRPGDVIVTAGFDKLQEGAVIQPQPTVPAAGGKGR